MKYTLIKRADVTEILFKKYLECKFQLHNIYVKSRFKKDSLLILSWSTQFKSHLAKTGGHCPSKGGDNFFYMSRDHRVNESRDPVEGG